MPTEQAQPRPDRQVASGRARRSAWHSASPEKENPVPKFIQEFKAFISRGNMIDLAVGIVIGAAFTAVVNSFVGDVFNALVGAIVGKPNFDELVLTIGDGNVFYGRFITAIVNFVIIGFALFLIVKAFNRFRREEEVAPALTEKDVLIEIRDLLRTGRTTD
jgi:large conductance mechanosensitive channel